MKVHLPTLLRRALLNGFASRRLASTLHAGALLAAFGTAAMAMELTWTGEQGAYWDSISTNWKDSSGQGRTFSERDSVTFDASGKNREITVAESHQLTAMTVTAGGYSFAGGGNFTVSDTLYVAIPDNIATLGEEALAESSELTLSFGPANNIHAGAILLQSGTGTKTVFGASVTAGSVSLTNCAVHADKNQAGVYVFEKDVTVGAAYATASGQGEPTASAGTFSALISHNDNTGAAARTMLTVNGAFSADAVVLGGSGNKLFNAAVLVAGDMSISGFRSTELDTGENGITTFSQDVNLGGTLRIADNAEAVFLGHLHPTSGKDDSSLNIVLNDGKLHCEAPVSPTGEAVCNLGTITLEGVGELSVGMDSRVQAMLDGAGHDFTVSGSSHLVEVVLMGEVGNFSVVGGNAYLADESVLMAEGEGAGTPVTEYKHIGGKLTVAAGASLTLVTNNIFGSAAKGADGGGLELDGTLQLGMTRQAFNGNIRLNSGSIISEKASASADESEGEAELMADDGMGEAGVPPALTGALVLDGATHITYSGTGNSVSAGLEAGAHTLAFTAKAEAAGGVAPILTLTGEVTGSGVLEMRGYERTDDGGTTYDKGTIYVASELSYAGKVNVGSGITLVLGSPSADGSGNLQACDAALASANGVEIGAGGTLSVVHGGTTSVFNGHYEYRYTETDAQGQAIEKSLDCGLFLGDGASLNFSNLSGYGKVPALELGSGMLLFGGNINITFNELGGDKLENLRTYELVTSTVGINQAPDTTTGSVNVYLNNKTTPLGSNQYQFSYYYDDDSVRHFTFTLLAGKSWNGGEAGSWHSAAGQPDNWNAGVESVEDVLFRQQTTASSTQNVLTDASGAPVTDSNGRYVMKDVTIALEQQASATGMYMDGLTNYTIEGKLGTGTQAFADEDGIYVDKRGEGVLNWKSLTATVSEVDIEQGQLLLSNGSHVSARGIVTVTDMAYDSVGVKHDSASLAIDSSSSFSSGGATISGYGTGTATLHGVRIEGALISGFDSGINDVQPNVSAESQDALTLTNTIHNAAVNGFRLEHLELTGTGSLSDTTLGEGMSIGSGAEYTVLGNVGVESTVSNSGTLHFSQDTVLILDGLAGDIGQANTYRLFTGGSYVGWDSQTLDSANFSLLGVNLGTLLNANGNPHKGTVTTTLTQEGEVTLTSTGVSFINWDKAWNVSDATTPILAMSVGTNFKQSLEVLTGNNGNKSFVYSKRVNYPDNDIFVANVDSGIGKAGNEIYGSNGGAGTPDEPINLWYNTEASLYGAYVAGATSGTFYGNSHMQVTGDLVNAEHVVGASREATQFGNSYLTLTTGTYTDTASADTIIAAGNYSSDGSGIHYGDSFLHLTGGSFGSVYGGSYGTYTGGTLVEDGVSTTYSGQTHVLVSNRSETDANGKVTMVIPTVENIYGGDYTTTASGSTHTGDVLIELQGGKLTNVYAAGGGQNTNKVTGNAWVKISAGDDGKMLSQFNSGAQILGGAATEDSAALVSGESSLVFTHAGKYHLLGVLIDRFDTFSLSPEAVVTLRANHFNVSSALTISGAGTVVIEEASSSALLPPAHDVTLKDNATLDLRSSYYQSSYESDARSTITAQAGTTINISGVPSKSDDLPNLNIALVLTGDGTQGQGALYKGHTDEDATAVGGVCFPSIRLEGNASVGVAAGAGLNMVSKLDDSAGAVLGDTELVLTGGGTSDERYVLTKKGEGSLGLYNTEVTGGIIYVEGGSLKSAYSSLASDTDLVLNKGASLELMQGLTGTHPGTGQPIAYNGLAVESLTGEGNVILGTTGWLYISQDNGHEDFGPHFTPDHGGYTYARFGGKITNSQTGAGSARVSKSGLGTQHFTGSESDYHGSTTVEEGTLYLWGTSTLVNPKEFARASMVDGVLTADYAIQKGVVGTASLVWEGSTTNGVYTGGEIYLGDGVRIYNSGEAGDGVRMRLGVGVTREGETITEYHTARFSGVLRDATPDARASFEKVGLGTLELDQDNQFSGGGFIRNGTLKLLGWAALDEGTIAPDTGASLMLAYDGSYAGEITAAITNFALSGTGDVRWAEEHEALEPGHAHTAALISDIGVNKTLSLNGSISSLDDEGGLLHSGLGTLVLTGANSYKGGTVVTDGTLRVEHDAALGDTSAEGGSELRLHDDARLTIAAGRNVVLAATGLAAEQTNNDLRGIVSLERGATLEMQADGYHAASTELEEGSQLVFRGSAASNWEKDSATLTGAVKLSGSGTVSVLGEGTKVAFAVTDSLHPESEDGFAGDMEVEGDRAELHIHGGELDGGNISVSGNGAKLEASGVTVRIEAGSFLALRSVQDLADVQAATLAAHSVEICEGGKLRVTNAAEALQFSLADVIPAGDGQVQLLALDATEGGESSFALSESLNPLAAGVLDADQLLLQGGSSYELHNSHLSLMGEDMLGGDLTLNVSSESKITLNAMLAYHRGEDSSSDAASGANRLVLFTDVANFSALLNGAEMLRVQGAEIALAAEDALAAPIYVAQAGDFFEASPLITPATTLVYDSGAQVVYLEHVNTNIPEPTTVTLSLLALAALCARRRRPQG